MPLSRLFAITLLIVVAAGACTRTVNVRVEGPHTKVTFAGRDLGEVPPSGESVDIPPGMEPVPFEVERGTESAVGSLARTEPVWWIVAAGVAGAACCAPTLAGAGFCLANPAIVGAPLAFAIAGDVGALTAPCVAPSWLTLPAVTTCAAVGLAPLGAAFAAETVPDEIVLRAPGSSPSPATSPSPSSHATEPAPTGTSAPSTTGRLSGAMGY